MDSRKISIISLLAALSAALEMVPGVPMPGAPFLKFDIAEAPVYIAAFITGLAGGIISVLGIAIAIVAVKGDPLGMMYKVVAVLFELIFLRLLRDHKFGRIFASVLRGVAMTIFDRVTIPLLYMPYVPLSLLAIIFVFNLIQGLINARIAVYAFETLRESEALCMLGLETCAPDTEEGQ